MQIVIQYDVENQAMQLEDNQHKAVIKSLNRLFETWLDKINIYDYNGNNVWIIKISEYNTTL